MVNGGVTVGGGGSRGGSSAGDRNGGSDGSRFSKTTPMFKVDCSLKTDS